MRCLSVVSVLSTVRDSWLDRSLENQQDSLCKKLHNILMWTGTEAKRHFSFNLPSDQVKLLFLSMDPGGFRAVVTKLSIVMQKITIYITAN